MSQSKMSKTTIPLSSRAARRPSRSLAAVAVGSGITLGSLLRTSSAVSYPASSQAGALEPVEIIEVSGPSGETEDVYISQEASGDSEGPYYAPPQQQQQPPAWGYQPPPQPYGYAPQQQAQPYPQQPYAQAQPYPQAYPQAPPQGYPQPGYGYQPTAPQNGPVQTTYRQQVRGSTPTGLITVGTPPVTIEVIFDTGSDKLLCKSWETVKHELSQVDAAIDSFVLPSDKVYNHDKSSSYKWMWSDEAKHNPKRGFIAYGSGMAITQEGQDLVNFGGTVLNSFPVSEITADSLFILHKKGSASGVMGLQHMKNSTKGESVFTRARKHGQMYAFGFCRGNKEDKSTFIWGDNSGDGHAIPVLGQIHWAVSLEHVDLPGAKMPAPRRAVVSREYHNGKHSATPAYPHHKTGAKAAATPPTPKSHPTVHNVAHVQHHSMESSRGSPPAMKKPAVPHQEVISMDGPKVQETEQDPFVEDADAPQGSEVEEVGDVEGHVEHMSYGAKYGLEGDDAEFVDSLIQQLSKGEELEGSRPNGRAMDWTKVMRQVQEVIGTLMKPAVPTLPLCKGSKCAAILDTGSNIIAGPSKAIFAIHQLAQIKFDCSNIPQLPHMTFRLGDFDVKLDPASYVMKVKLPSWARPLAHHLHALHQEDMESAGGAALAEDASIFNPWRLTLDHLERKYGIDLSAALHANEDKIEDVAHLDKLCLPAFVPLNMNTSIGELWVVGTPVMEQYYARWSWPLNQESPSIYLSDRKTAQACSNQANQAQQAQPMQQPYGYPQPPMQQPYGYPQPQAQPYYPQPPQQPYYYPQQQPMQQPYGYSPYGQQHYSNGQGQGQAQAQEEQPAGRHQQQHPASGKMMRSESKVVSQEPASLIEDVPVAVAADEEAAVVDEIALREFDIEEIRFPHWARNLDQI